MTNFTYEKILADSTDPDNATGRRPGIILNIGERDGGIVIGSAPVGREKNPEEWRYVIVNPDEVDEIIVALRDAARQAGKRPDGTHWHPTRSRYPQASK